MKNNKIRRYVVVFISLSLLLLSSVFYGYLQNRQLEDYALRLTALGHHLIHLRDEVILASHQTPFPAATFMIELEAVESDIATFQQEQTTLLPDILNPGVLAHIADTFYHATLRLTLQLTDLVEVSGVMPKCQRQNLLPRISMLSRPTCTVFCSPKRVWILSKNRRCKLVSCKPSIEI